MSSFSSECVWTSAVECHFPLADNIRYMDSAFLSRRLYACFRWPGYKFSKLIHASKFIWMVKPHCLSKICESNCHLNKNMSTLWICMDSCITIYYIYVLYRFLNILNIYIYICIYIWITVSRCFACSVGVNRYLFMTISCWTNIT